MQPTVGEELSLLDSLSSNEFQFTADLCDQLDALAATNPKKAIEFATKHSLKPTTKLAQMLADSHSLFRIWGLTKAEIPQQLSLEQEIESLSLPDCLAQ